MKNKENSNKDSKSLKKTLKKNLKELKDEKKKAIKKVKNEKDKAIKAIKKLSKGKEGLKADKKESRKKDKKENGGKKEKIKSDKLKENLEKSSEVTATTYQSVDLKADEAISRVMVLNAVPDIDNFVKKEKRSTILKAAEKRKSELDQAS